MRAWGAVPTPTTRGWPLPLRSPCWSAARSTRSTSATHSSPPTIRDGVMAPGTRAVLALISDGVAAIDAAGSVKDGAGSLGNGAAMRVAPIAVRYVHDPDALLDAVRRSARVTHAHPIGIEAAVVQAAAVGASLRGEDVLTVARATAATDELRSGLTNAARLLKERPPPDAVAATLGNRSGGHRSVPAAIYAAVAHAGFEDAVTFAVRVRWRRRHDRCDGRSDRRSPARRDSDRRPLTRRARGRTQRTQVRLAERLATSGH